MGEGMIFDTPPKSGYDAPKWARDFVSLAVEFRLPFRRVVEIVQRNSKLDGFCAFYFVQAQYTAAGLRCDDGRGR